MKKYKYNINNLDCANCAREIEETLNKRIDMNNVIVNFNTSILSYESEKEFTLNELNSIVKSIEPDSYLSEEKIEIKKEYHLSILIIAIIICTISYFLKIPKFIKIILYIISYSLLLYRTTINAIKLLLKKHSINENLLITISCIGALLLGEVMEGMMVIVLYTIGKILEEKAINNSRRSIKDLLDIKEPYANLKKHNKVEKIEVEKINIGDILIVKKGEKVPVDGIILKGESSFDMSSLTGESDLVEKYIEDELLSGSINMGEVIEMKATKVYNDSTVAKILDLLESATDKKTKTETMISKISKIYTPTVIVLAILIIIFLPLLFDVKLTDAIYRGLTFLVISCPCAIAISIPLSYFTGIGVSSKKGILIKGSDYLDNLSNAKNIIFDKTGTLTYGTMYVTSIEIFDQEYTLEKISEILKKGESFSNHPISKAIMQLPGKKVNNKNVKNFKEIEGKGIEFDLNKKHIKIGNKNLCNCNDNTTLHLNIDGSHVASITIDDGIKDDALDTIYELKKQGLKTYMFTGDKKDIALTIGNLLGIDEIKYEMLPTDKFENYEQVSSTGTTIFVGDGINDAPVLKRADIGISMGNVGSDSAIEASDIVLISDEVIKIPEAINISKYTKHIIKQNLVFAMSIKIIILLLSVFGFANMYLAVFADTGVTLLTILNTLRITKK